MTGIVPPVANQAISSKEYRKCLCRILPSAWSARQRTTFPIPRVSKFAPPRMTSRWYGLPGLACLSRTGSSSSVIRVCGCSAFVDQLTRSAIDRVLRRCADARIQKAPVGKPAGVFAFGSMRFYSLRLRELPRCRGRERPLVSSLQFRYTKKYISAVSFLPLVTRRTRSARPSRLSF